MEFEPELYFFDSLFLSHCPFFLILAYRFMPSLFFFLYIPPFFTGRITHIFFAHLGFTYTTWISVKSDFIII